MSVFSLDDVAGLIGKSPRTVRRWCIAGLVPGAVCSAGGHWKIEGYNLPTAAALALRGARGFSRKRACQKTTLGGKPIPAEVIARVESVKIKMAKRLPDSLRVLRVLESMPDFLRPDSIGETPLLADAVISALAWSMISTGDFRPTVNAIAPAFGMGRRKFYRRFGAKLRDARLAAVSMLTLREPKKVFFGEGQDAIAAEDFNFDEIDARLGWGEPSAAA